MNEELRTQLEAAIVLAREPGTAVLLASLSPHGIQMAQFQKECLNLLASYQELNNHNLANQALR
jgi:polysaccharide deacetylase 2 family uncharacterized protein YibQ